MSDEVSRYWNAITDDNGLYEFDRKEKKIAGLELVTKEQVQKAFDDLMFGDVRRLNVKLYSHNHFVNKDEIKESEEKNGIFYREKSNLIAPNEVTKVTSYKAFKLRHQMFPRI